MINTERYEKLLSDGMSLDHYFVLVALANGQPLPKGPRVQGFLKLLELKEYILAGALTQKGFAILYSEDKGTPPGPKDQLVDFEDWCVELHRHLEDHLEKLTGGRQVRDTLNGKKWPFLCGAVDLAGRLRKVIKRYKLQDPAAIEATLLRHIDNCHKAGKWFPLMKYYIEKDGSSDLVTDLQSGSEPGEDAPSQNVNPKDLF